MGNGAAHAAAAAAEAKPRRIAAAMPPSFLLSDDPLPPLLHFVKPLNQSHELLVRGPFLTVINTYCPTSKPKIQNCYKDPIF